ncbi:hypothetical protein HJFPF1_07317 [Paramyrothecium foliicola]|nr:hypothetical protein HJFPF1_07317 [Paramyrothecium foliicola]
MRASSLFAFAAALGVATAGFATYKEIREGEDNSDEIAYYELDRSDTLFLYLQIIAGGDHQDLIGDFKTLAQNYGSRGVSVVPRVRYGYPDGSIATEPEDAELILEDASTWASVFKEVACTINIPVIQAGFLGLWGEWHVRIVPSSHTAFFLGRLTHLQGGPFTQARGADDDASALELKGKIVETLRSTGIKVALRYPEDHKMLYENDRSVTIHNDCMLSSGPTGTDGGTFPEEDRQTWVDYTKAVASDNTYGGEPCNQSSDANYDWSNFDSVCGSNGLEAYVHEYKISYLNVSTALVLVSGKKTCNDRTVSLETPPNCSSFSTIQTTPSALTPLVLLLNHTPEISRW